MRHDNNIFHTNYAKKFVSKEGGIMQNFQLTDRTNQKRKQLCRPVRPCNKVVIDRKPCWSTFIPSSQIRQMQWFCTTNRTTTTNSAPASSISLVVHVNITWVRDRTRSPVPISALLPPLCPSSSSSSLSRAREGWMRTDRWGSSRASYRHEVLDAYACTMTSSCLRSRKTPSLPAKIVITVSSKKKDRYYLPAIDQRISEIEEYLVVQSFLQPSQKSAERELAQVKSTYPKRS